MNNAAKLSRKTRRRLGAALERKARVSDQALAHSGMVTVAEEELVALHTMQRFFVAMVKEQGRVRVTTATLDSLAPGDSVKRSDVLGAVMLTYKPAPAPEEGSAG